ncbi:MAG TPA: gliding motility-associated C-terminal domain-containing protein [Cyclobacteriaceae bacterium]|nr:gliding motility-associated C-terminal domain-containing protein [Cyclobacteriaceae bacterium]
MRLRSIFIKIFLFAAIFGFAGLYQVHATHLRAGEITVVRENCSSLQFIITVTVYTNTGSSVLFGGRTGEEDILDFGDGESMLVPETPNTLRPDLGPAIGTASFTIVHTFPGPGVYTISYREPNRNEGVLNMDNSVNTRFYIETQVIIDPFLGCNNSPRLLVAPIDQACTGVAFFHNPGAYDPDGDSLSYELVVPYSDNDLPVVRYQDPAANSPRQFYTDYDIGNENGDGPPSFVIDPVTGTIEWNSPGKAGEYNIAFVIKEWRKIAGQGWVQVGFVRRDMQILVNDCDNERPDLIIPADTCVEAGTKLSAKIFGIDPENHPVKIEAFSEIFNFGSAQSPATISPTPEFRPSNPPYELDFEWNTICDHVKEQPYQVVFKITDNPGNTGPKLVTFKTWNIKVVGPKPVWQTATLNPSQRSTALDWEDYTCTNAQTMQIYRRVDSFPYDPSNCETGMPDFLGYELIKEVPISGASNYVDNNGGQGLAPGARYCYRLVAVFPAPKGGESYMSEEICVGPILADAPIVTNVTIDKTDQAEGQITVKWREPFDADPGQFPPPYSYLVFRGTGFTGTPTVDVTNGVKTTSLSIVDNGLNTTDEIYNYVILAYDAGGGFIDSSAVASSVRLEAKSELQRIELSWSAFVPWSNNTPNYPMHSIYRGPEGATEDELELIDNVNVNVNGFIYIDEGQYNNEPLHDDQVYCYRVMTQGAYGNPQIDEPLINFSQIICAQPSDAIPPCKVETPVAINAPDCDNYPSDQCTKTVFSNRIEWTRPNEGTCQNDISYYKIYSASSEGGTFALLATNVKDLFYVDENLPSHARCYKVSAVDRSGNEGELSDPVCIDNCPYYELPNIFTPNGDKCNDVFSAYSDKSRFALPGESGQYECGGITDETKCARFVDRVDFKVFNRWGKEVYSYRSGGERSIYIDWDGRDNNGRELSTGIYYYIADVTFITIDPSKRNQTIKGWVHILK